MEVEIMGHDRRAEDADRDVKHARIGHDSRGRHETFGNPQQIRPGGHDLPRETAADNKDERDDERLDVAKAFVLKKQNEQNIQRRDADTGEQRQAEEQIERNGRADHFREIAGGDRDLANHPEKKRDRLAEMVAASLGQVAAGGDTELERERLEQDRRQVRQHDDREERVIVFRAARQVRGPISRVHVTDGDEKSRTGESDEFAEEARGGRNDEGAMNFRKAWALRRTSPPNGRMRYLGFANISHG